MRIIFYNNIDHQSKSLSDVIIDYGNCSTDLQGKKYNSLLANKHIKNLSVVFLMVS